MSRTALRVVLGIVAIAVGVGMAMFWHQLRPMDPWWPTTIGAGAATAIATFIAAYFMTTASGGGS